MKNNRYICAFKIYHAGPSNNISERRLYHACGFYSVGELQVINLSKILQQIFSNKFSRFYIKYLFQDPDRGWRTYWGILWLHRGCDQFKVKCSLWKSQCWVRMAAVGLFQRGPRLARGWPSALPKVPALGPHIEVFGLFDKPNNVTPTDTGSQAHIWMG